MTASMFHRNVHSVSSGSRRVVLQVDTTFRRIILTPSSVMHWPWRYRMHTSPTCCVHLPYCVFSQLRTPLSEHIPPWKSKNLYSCPDIENSFCIVLCVLYSKVAPVLNEWSTTPWRRMGEWMYRFTFSWPRHQLEVSGQLHVPSKSSHYPLDKRLDGPQSRSGRRGETKFLDRPGTRTPTPWSFSP
jgi:hypothetical protein